MTRVLFCILNYFNEKEFVKIKPKVIKIEKETAIKNNTIANRINYNVGLEVDGIILYFFLKEITHWTNFRTILLSIQCLKETIFIIKVVPPKKEALDYKWNEIVSRTVWEKVEIDNLISWLSTLGGGFSALGETFTHHAEIAGKISLKQLSLGLKLGDPFLQSRCMLFYSISLIQRGKLRTAKKIIRQQYVFALRVKEIDQKLVNMCEGIWLKLQYAYSQRRKKNTKLECNGKC